MHTCLTLTDLEFEICPHLESFMSGVMSWIGKFSMLIGNDYIFNTQKLSLEVNGIK